MAKECVLKDLPYICWTVSEIKVHIKDRASYQIEILGKNEAMMNDQKMSFDKVKLSEGKYHIVKDKRSYEIEVVKADFESKTFEIKVNNKMVFLEAEDRFDQLLHQLGMDNLGSSAISELKAPMPGLVLEIPISLGQEVKKDEPLLVLEAMKMENVLKSPSDVVVKNIAVEKGNAVEKNQVLIEFEN